MDTPHNNSRSDLQPEHHSGVPVPAAQRQAQDAPEGAPPSNTAPSNRIEESSYTQILQTGVDSLYLSYAGDLKATVEAELESLKSLAQSEDPLERASAVYPLCDHRFEVKDKGKGRYPFVLQDGLFHLQISRSQAKSLPMIYAQISSEALTRTGVAYTEIALKNLVSVMGSKLSPAIVSRVDLCADFVTGFQVDEIPKGAWINRAAKRSYHEDRGRFSGLTFGMGGQLSARLYDKTLEIGKSGKTYLYDVWGNAGWEGDYPVWRLEFEFHRSVLRDFGINTVEDLLNRRADLWAYAMQWLRLVVPSKTDSSKERWPNHPLWKALTEAAWESERGEPLTRTRKTRPPSDRFLFVNGLGSIISYMALNNILDIDEGTDCYLKEAHAHHLRESRRTGKTLSTYAREKAVEKARRFNTLIQSTPQPEIGEPAKRKRAAK